MRWRAITLNTHGRQTRSGVFNIPVLLLTAGALFRVASTLVERIVSARAKDPALTMAEIKKLEAIRKAQ